MTTGLIHICYSFVFVKIKKLIYTTFAALITHCNEKGYNYMINFSEKREIKILKSIDSCLHDLVTNVYL